MPRPEVQVAAVQPVIDPATIRLIWDCWAVAQHGQPRLGVRDGVQDFGRSEFSSELIAEAAGRPDVELIDLERLYRGA